MVSPNSIVVYYTPSIRQFRKIPKRSVNFACPRNITPKCVHPQVVEWGQNQCYGVTYHRVKITHLNVLSLVLNFSLENTLYWPFVSTITLQRFVAPCSAIEESLSLQLDTFRRPIVSVFQGGGAPFGHLFHPMVSQLVRLQSTLGAIDQRAKCHGSFSLGGY